MFSRSLGAKKATMTEKLGSIRLLLLRVRVQGLSPATHPLLFTCHNEL